MADEQSQTQSTETKTEPLGNSEAARNPDGSLKDTQTQTQEQSSEKTEAKTESTEGKTETKPEPKSGAPEAYADFTAPEGYELNQEVLDRAVPLFKELNLSQEQAQKLVSFYGDAALKAEEAPYAAYETMRSNWRKQIIASDLGNGTDDLKPEVIAVIGRAIDSLPAKVASEFREAMTLTGAGDNPAFIRAFHALASQIGEGTLVAGRGPSPQGQSDTRRPASAAAALYPNLPTSAR